VALLLAMEAEALSSAASLAYQGPASSARFSLDGTLAFTGPLLSFYIRKL